MYDYIVLFLIIIVLFYLGLNFKLIKPIDIIFIIIGLFILALSTWNKQSIEKFDNTGLPSDKIQLEENVTDIVPSCVMYYTTFNSNSYTVKNGNTWNSILPIGTKNKLIFDS